MGELNSAAHDGWSSCPQWRGLLSLVFTCFSCGQWELSLTSGMSTHPSWHLCSLALSLLHPSHQGQKRRLGPTQTWTAESTGSYLLFHLLPSYADKILGDKKCCCSSTSIAGRWACFDFQVVPLWEYLVAQHLQRSLVALGESRTIYPGAGMAREWLLDSKLVSVLVRNSRKKEIRKTDPADYLCPWVFLNKREKRSNIDLASLFRSCQSGKSPA